ncbi:PepSY-associated TM helix domain-containing protein [Allohahella sp. A8]|uniref:PepSY-associated TM helix domain-containing protein n=1 Tax=Allohahella sp. A8 TaxID=3141461 RepID=UPI00267885BF|tara:strand:+ start:21970 stop:23097 length:1128 start_codon:yes stop_codon:yes gene_type:complete
MAINRRRWFKVHGLLALPVWLLFAFVCFTGTIAVISHELTWLTNPAARASNPADLPVRPLHELVDAVKAEVPDAAVSNVMLMEPYLVAAVSFSSANFPVALAYVNPYTADVQMINDGLTFIGFMRSLHGWLLFPWYHSYSIGYYLVGAMSLVTLGALITGAVVYKRFWRAYTRPVFRLGRGLRVALGDFHRLAGAWSLWFLLLMGLTGLWYLVQGILWHNEVEIETAVTPVPLSDVPLLSDEDSTVPRPVSLEAALAQARHALPSIQPAWVSLPEHARDHFMIAGAGDSLFHDQYAYGASVNQWTGEISSLRRPETMNVLQTLTHIADPLHYGTIGGLWTKVIWFVFGLLLSTMALSGFMIWTRRTVRGVQGGAV